VITIHVPLEFRSHLDQLLSAAGPLPATFATDGDARENGHVYVAPPGRHFRFAEGMRSDAAHPTNGSHQLSPSAANWRVLVWVPHLDRGGQEELE